jgi:hypothetical protein
LYRHQLHSGHRFRQHEDHIDWVFELRYSNKFRDHEYPRRDEHVRLYDHSDSEYTRPGPRFNILSIFLLVYNMASMLTLSG